MPAELVFGRILPALGLMMFLSTAYYAWLAYQLARRTGRDDVCALPSGVSVPHMFVVTFVIMLPIASATGDPVKGWEAGPGLGVLPELHPDDRRLHRPLYPPDHAARRPARHARRRLDRLHLDAPGARDLLEPGDRRGLLRDHPGQLVRRRALSARHPGRPGRDRASAWSSPGWSRGRLGRRRRRHRQARRRRSPISASRCRSRPPTMSSPASSIWA